MERRKTNPEENVMKFHFPYRIRKNNIGIMQKTVKRFPVSIRFRLKSKTNGKKTFSEAGLRRNLSHKTHYVSINRMIFWCASLTESGIGL